MEGHKTRVLMVTTIDTYNVSEGIHVTFLYVNDVTGGLFINLLLLSLFLIVGMGSFIAQKKTTGFGNIWGSFSAAGIITTVSALILSSIDGLVPTYTVIISIIVTIVSVLLLLTGRD